MGKASSAKKVARAARAGGSSHRERPKIAFPAAIFAVLVAGVLLVTVSRTAHSDLAGAEVAPSSANQDHFHAAYGFYVCDKYLPPDPNPEVDALGIHTHGDGVIHIHPFTALASGTRAKLKVFADNIGVKFTDDSWTGSDGITHKTGDDCGGQPGKVAVYRYKPDNPTAPIEVYEKDFNNIVFNEDRNAYSIAILPEGKEPPPMPDTVAELDKLTDVPSSAGAEQLDPTASTPNVSVDPSASTPSVPGEPTASTPSVPGEPTASTPSPSTPSVSTPTVSTP